MDIEKDFVWNERDGCAVLEKYVKKYKNERDEKEEGTPEPKETIIDIPAERAGKPVKEIFDAAFSMNEVIEEVRIPSSVEKIGSMAFNSCRHLKKITLSPSLKRLGFFALNDTPLKEDEAYRCGKAFVVDGWLAGCDEDAEEIEIPPRVVGVADYAFYFNRKLKKILLPETVKFIGMRAFAFELSLDEVYIPRSVEEAHWQIFGANVTIGKLTIPQEIYERQKFEKSVKIEEIVLL